MEKRMLLVVNPRSGTASAKNKFLDILEILAKHGFEITVHTTLGKGDAREQIFSRAKSHDLVVCCGGDGTVNEAFAAISALESAPPLGIIPAGTTNDFAHTLSIPTDPLAAASAICNGELFPCDCGLFDNRVFAYTAAFGMFTDVTYETPQQQKNLLGHAAYVLEGIKNLPHYAPYPMTIECESGVFEGEYLLGMVTNTVSVGGFRKIFDSVAQLDDGLLEVTLIKKPRALSDYQKIINIILGGGHAESTENEFLTVLSVPSLHIKSGNPVAWTLDGEEGGLHSEVVIRAKQKAVTLVVPKKSDTETFPQY